MLNSSKDQHDLPSDDYDFSEGISEVERTENGKPVFGMTKKDDRTLRDLKNAGAIFGDTKLAELI